MADAGADFGFESTLSSRSFAPFLRSLKAKGYQVAIYYFSLPNTQLAVRRVKLRVSLGGHNVPTDVVLRRFTRSLHNFFSFYAPLADAWTLFDNASEAQAQAVAAQLGNQLTIFDAPKWQKLQKLNPPV